MNALRPLQLATLLQLLAPVAVAVSVAVAVPVLAPEVVPPASARAAAGAALAPATCVHFRSGQQLLKLQAWGADSILVTATPDGAAAPPVAYPGWRTADAAREAASHAHPGTHQIDST